ncbi:MAG: ribosome maturation factor RimP [Thermodesulfovibrionia bacterium]|nr:ribosome maturation factor RimP [Thermodesulfovibrionia bacterium]
MDIKELEDKVKNIIEPVINSIGIELDRLSIRKMHGSYLMRVFIDKDNGITIDDCENVSREIEAILDVEDPIPGSYVLEVSSPGLDRPLKGAADFRKHIGKIARVVINNSIDKQTFFVGKILQSDDLGVVLLLPKDKEMKIPFENISKARLEVEVE